MKNKLSKKRIAGIMIIIGVIIIPLLYSYLYLGAFWDPYSRLETLPVAVVNNDKGAVINGEDRNVGNEMVDNLKKDASLKFVFTDEQDAKTGTEGNDYYAMLIIPDNFSADIASANSTDKHTATITYSANEKRNFLASQILSSAVIKIEESTRANVDKEIVQQLTDNIKGVPGQMTELQNGLGDLKDGSQKLKSGADTLADGTQTFHDKFGEYQKGVTDLQSGSGTLVNGAASLNSGIDELLNGANQLATSTAGVDQLTTGAKSLAAGAKTFNTSLNQYITGVDSLISSVNSTSEFLTQYVTNVNPAIMKDPVFAGFIKKLSDPANAQNMKALLAADAKLKEASGQISAGADKLAAGSTSLPKLKDALNTLAAGLSQAKSGSAELAEGSKSLSAGLSSLGSATTQLSDAANDINDGAKTLDQGASELDNGIGTAKSGVDTTITDANNQLNSLDGLAAYAEAPVKIEQDNVTSVPNYGTAFAPYFLSLSLWVGAIILFVGIYLDSEGKFKILSRNSEHKATRSFLYLVIGIVQAIVLAQAIRYGLGLEVKEPVLYYLSCCLVSLAFISIVQFCMVHFKDLGKFLSIVLLILQLTSCGGTFPMQTVPKFFNVLYPFMPMTYSVGLFKQAISGAVQSEVILNAGVLVGILVVFMALTILLSFIKGRMAKQKELLEAQ